MQQDEIPFGDDAILFGLASGQTIRATAKIAGVSETTIWRRLQVPKFRHALSVLRDDAFRAATDRLIANAEKAVDRIGALIDDGESDAVRLAAAKAVLELGTKLRDATEFQERLQRLEAEREPDANTEAA